MTMRPETIRQIASLIHRSGPEIAADRIRRLPQMFAHPKPAEFQAALDAVQRGELKPDAGLWATYSEPAPPGPGPVLKLEVAPPGQG